MTTVENGHSDIGSSTSSKRSVNQTAGRRTTLATEPDPMASAAPTRAAGVIRNVTTGIAKRLANGPITENDEKNQTERGARAKVAAACATAPA